jgi:hypothetical protein
MSELQLPQLPKDLSHHSNEFVKQEDHYDQEAQGF